MRTIGLSRRMAVATGLGFAFTASQSRTGCAAPEVYRLGVLTDLSGPYSDFAGRGSVEAVRMAVEDFGSKLLGRPVEVIAGDHQNKPDTGLTLARQWIDERNVVMITDLISAGVAIAVQKLAGERNIAAIVSGTPTAELSGVFCTPSSVHFTDDTYAISQGIVDGLEIVSGEAWYFLVADYAFGDQFLRDLTSVLTERGGTVAGVSRHPLGASEYSAYILSAQASGAKTIAFVNAGTDTANSVKQAREFGLTDGYRFIAPVFPPQTVLGLGPTDASDIISATGFVWDMNERTAVVSKRFHERLGYLPGNAHYCAYAGTLAFLNAAAATGSVAGDQVVRRLRRAPLDPSTGFSGSISNTGRLERGILVVEAKLPQSPVYPDDVLGIVKRIPVAALRAPSTEAACKISASAEVLGH